MENVIQVAGPDATLWVIPMMMGACYVLSVAIPLYYQLNMSAASRGPLVFFSWGRVFWSLALPLGFAFFSAKFASIGIVPGAVELRYWGPFKKSLPADQVRFLTVLRNDFIGDGGARTGSTWHLCIVDRGGTRRCSDRAERKTAVDTGRRLAEHLGSTLDWERERNGQARAPSSEDEVAKD